MQKYYQFLKQHYRINHKRDAWWSLSDTNEWYKEFWPGLSYYAKQMNFVEVWRGLPYWQKINRVRVINGGYYRRH